jgi:antitoxin ParD1/3/4
MARNTSVALGDHFTKFIDDQVASGRYATASEVVRNGLRLLEAEERQLALPREKIAEGEAAIRAGHAYEESDEFWDDLNREVDDEALTRGDQPSPHACSQEQEYPHR